jgi:hypothetical protein
MRNEFIYSALLLAGLFLIVRGPALLKKDLGANIQDTMKTDIEKLNQPVVRKAIKALQAADSKTWFSLFTDDAALYDDGSSRNFKSFFGKAIGQEKFLSIDKVQDNGLSLYGKFHSDTWGDFKTYFKFQINQEGRITRLDIGQAKY